MNILQNDGSGSFTLVTPSFLTGSPAEAGDGITMGDVDNDGDLDMMLVSDGPPSTASLYRNGGNGSFFHDTTWTDVNGYMGGFADLDNDGDLDLVFAGDTRCYLNDGTGCFTSGPTVPMEDVDDPRSIAFADIDDDGDMDFAVSDKKSRCRLIQNDLTDGGHWLKVRLISPQGQAGAFGAKTTIYPAGQAGQAGGTILGFRESRSNNGYLGQDDPVLHFGLGSHLTVDVVVQFLDGTTLFRTNVAARQTITMDGSTILVQTKVFLEGAYEEGLERMSDSLNANGLIPFTAPYSEDQRSVSSVPENVVDWVLVQLYSSPSGSVVASRSCFLHRDGRVVDDDGGNGLIRIRAPEGSYYLALKHRNHLAVMGSTPVKLTSYETVFIDFTTGINRFYGTWGGKQLDPGVWGTAGGNADASDQDIFASDLASIKVGFLSGVDGYWAADTDMDGRVSISDYEMCRHNVLGGFYSMIRDQR